MIQISNLSSESAVIKLRYIPRKICHLIGALQYSSTSQTLFVQVKNSVLTRCQSSYWLLQRHFHTKRMQFDPDPNQRFGMLETKPTVERIITGQFCGN